MTKRYAILRRKLEQLEAIIARVSALPPETPCHQLLSESEGIEQRFDFLKNLLSTEMASHPSKLPHHLLHIERKSNQLESTFRKWDDYRKSIISNYNNNNVDDDDDSDSVCSCTESCLNDNGEVLAESGFCDFGLTNSTTIYHHDQVAENFYDAVAPPVDDLIKRKKWSTVWKRRYCAVMVVGVTLIINLSGYFHDTDHEGFLTPT